MFAVDVFVLLSTLFGVVLCDWLQYRRSASLNQYVPDLKITEDENWLLPLPGNGSVSLFFLEISNFVNSGNAFVVDSRDNKHVGWVLYFDVEELQLSLVGLCLSCGRYKFQLTLQQHFNRSGPWDLPYMPLQLDNIVTYMDPGPGESLDPRDLTIRAVDVDDEGKEIWNLVPPEPFAFVGLWPLGNYALYNGSEAYVATMLYYGGPTCSYETSSSVVREEGDFIYRFCFRIGLFDFQAPNSLVWKSEESWTCNDDSVEACPIMSIVYGQNGDGNGILLFPLMVTGSDNGVLIRIHKYDMKDVQDPTYSTLLLPANFADYSQNVVTVSGTVGFVMGPLTASDVRVGFYGFDVPSLASKWSWEYASPYFGFASSCFMPVGTEDEDLFVGMCSFFTSKNAKGTVGIVWGIDVSTGKQRWKQSLVNCTNAVSLTIMERQNVVLVRCTHLFRLTMKKDVLLDAKTGKIIKILEYPEPSGLVSVTDVAVQDHVYWCQDFPDLQTFVPSTCVKKTWKETRKNV